MSTVSGQLAVLDRLLEQRREQALRHRQPVRSSSAARSPGAVGPQQADADLPLAPAIGVDRQHRLDRALERDEPAALADRRQDAVARAQVVVADHVGDQALPCRRSSA